MRIRTYTEADMPALQRMHAKHAEYYNFPNLENPLFVSKIVVENGAHRTVMAALLRLTCEAYVLVDSEDGTPNQRWERLKALHEVTRQQAERAGLEDVHAFLPPDISEGFCRRLGKMGWTEDSSRCFWRSTKHGGN